LPKIKRVKKPQNYRGESRPKCFLTLHMCNQQPDTPTLIGIKIINDKHNISTILLFVTKPTTKLFLDLHSWAFLLSECWVLSVSRLSVTFLSLPTFHFQFGINKTHLIP